MDICQYCSRPADIQVEKNTFVCSVCWKLLQNPATALPLIRGHLTMTLRGKMPDAELKRKIDMFMAMIGNWKPIIKN